MRTLVSGLFLAVLCSRCPPGRCPDPKPDAGELSYEAITRLPFMGGSLLYDAGRPAASHLAPKARIPIRLGLVREAPAPGSYPAGAPAVEYSDDDSAAEFGILEVGAASADGIAFGLVLFDRAGRARPVKTFQLTPSAQADLNENGRPDVEYVASINPNRPVVHGRMYLRFISSRATLSTAMFSYVPRLLPHLPKAGGSLGFNTSGNAIIVMDPAHGTTKGGATAVESGDVVVDPGSGRYLQASERTSAEAMTASKAPGAPASAMRDVQDLSEILPVFWMNTSRVPPREARAVKAIDRPTLVADEAEYARRLQALRRRLEQYPLTATIPFPGSLKKCADGICVDFTGSSVKVGVDASLSISWSRVRGSIGSMLLVEASLAAISENGGRLATGPGGRSFPIGDGWSATFAIGPILVDVGARPTVGFIADLSLAPGARMGFGACAAYETGAGVTVKLSGVDPDHWHRTEAFMHPDMQMLAVAGVQQKLVPTIGLVPRFALQKVLVVETPITAGMGPYWIARCSASSSGKVDATVGIESDLHASLEGKVQVRLLGKLWDTKLFGFPLYTARTSLWEKSYSMVATEGCRAAEIVNVTYPVAECPAPLVYDTLARCVPKPLCENPPCKARVAVQVKWPSTGTDLVHLKWVWSRDRTVFLEKEVLFERSPTELCQFPEAPPHSRLRCAVIRETFEGIEPGEVDFTVWDQDRYNLITKGAAYIPPRTIVQFRCRYPGDHYACETVSEALP